MFEDLFIVDNPQAPARSNGSNLDNRASVESERSPLPAEGIMHANNDTSNPSRPDSGHDLSQLTEVPKEEDAPLLHNRKGPAYIRQQEQPWHRLVLELSAKGFTCREIAERVGRSDVAVQDILKQPYYQQGLANLIRKETNKDQEVYELVQNNVVKAVKTLKEIMEDEKQSAAYRIAAAKELLDRRYGKPNQPINRNTDVDLSQLSDSELLKLMQQN